MAVWLACLFIAFKVLYEASFVPNERDGIIIIASGALGSLIYKLWLPPHQRLEEIYRTLQTLDRRISGEMSPSFVDGQRDRILELIKGNAPSTALEIPDSLRTILQPTTEVQSA